MPGPTRVAIGSKNPAKTLGVRRAFGTSFKGLEFKEVDTSAVVRIQPMTLSETVEGAEERAVYAMESARPDFSVGVEAGLMGLGKGRPGHFLNLQVAAIVDRAGHLSYGCSSGFEIPKEFVTRLKKERVELDRYAHELTGAERVREEEGIVYHLSRKRLSRVEMTEQCVSMALLPWLNRKLYAIG